MTILPPIDWANDDPEQMRRDYANLRAELLVDMPADVEVTVEHRVGLKGLHFRPETEAGAPILYFHGGSWMIGSPDTHRVLCAMLAKTSRRRVISVSYRLAPEHLWPAQPDDAVARLRGCLAHEGRVFVAGDSAGAAMALWADAGVPGATLGVIGLYGAYGVVDSPSLRALGPQDGTLTCQGMQDIYNRIGLRDPAEVRDRISPTGAPVCLVKATDDPLADDNTQLLNLIAERPHRVIEAPGQPHAFMHDAARDAEVLSLLKQVVRWMDSVEIQV
ncbi:alpha/beta hydrolase fold domain-containing protein [Shimia ponticola]|uniref:alpha/beta hydrolase fold domain-containing protein n=1 Tax=Shimia ponticola TaxID=2582893 RepID=UPI0011BDFEBF|nr:alpha/beta hydrolase fold domain-containing protein [Shimia ponticola]